MVDWEAVGKRRAQGWDWDRIAQDPSVGFRPVPRPEHPGAALRSIYERRERAFHGQPPREPLPESLAASAKPRWTLARVGFVLVPFFGIWGLFAYTLAAPVGLYVPAVPLVALCFAVAAFLLAFGLLRTSPRWNRSYRQAVLAGTAAGVMVVAVVGGVAAFQGAPLLTPFVSGEPNGWEKLSGAQWTANGAPVVFFVGSVACPYCSASSWAIAAALLQFGNLSGLAYGHSSPTDVYPNTPEVILASSQLRSSWLSWEPLESTDGQTVVFPTPTNVVQQAYLSAYDAEGSVPFLVVGGLYAHVGTLVDPSALAGLSSSVVWGQVLNESGPAWVAVAPAAEFFEAFLWKADGGQPAQLGSDPAVAADAAEIR
jgi:hypothetical protein